MKKLIFLLCLTYACIARAQQVTIPHLHYTTTFDEKLHYPVLVTWTLKASDVCPKGSAHWVDRSKYPFVADPKLPAFTNLRAYYKDNPGKWQQGHNCDADDNSCNPSEMAESFYYSNMTPQAPDLNEHRWAELEAYTRKLAATTTVQVWCGSYGQQTMMGPVSVPKYCWKILKYGNTEEVYLMPNDASVMQHPYTYYKTVATVADIRKATGLPLTGL